MATKTGEVSKGGDAVDRGYKKKESEEEKKKEKEKEMSPWRDNRTTNIER